jgi:hypothetical protein
MGQYLVNQLSQCRLWGSACYLLHAGFLLGLFVNLEDAGGMFHRNAN